MTSDSTRQYKTDVQIGDHQTQFSNCEWRLRFHVADLAHYTEWHSDFATVENLYDQYRRDDHATDPTIERREVVRT